MEKVIQADLLALERPEIFREVFNITRKQRITINDFLSALQGIAGRKIPLRFVHPERGGMAFSFIYPFGAGPSRCEVKVGLEEGLTATWPWFRKRGV